MWNAANTCVYQGGIGIVSVAYARKNFAPHEMLRVESCGTDAFSKLPKRITSYRAENE